MHRNHVVATCCYCGTRAALNLAGAGARHELACSNCGAPLRQLKNLRLDTAAATPAKRKPARTPPKPRKPKRRKSMAARLRDLAEEIADEIFD